jgi:hypothetical protein
MDEGPFRVGERKFSRILAESRELRGDIEATRRTNASKNWLRECQEIFKPVAGESWESQHETQETEPGPSRDRDGLSDQWAKRQRNEE